MANQTLNVDLLFNANTSAAKQAIIELQTQLSKISSMNFSTEGLKITEQELHQASSAARELSIHLQSAVNVNTGKLDLNKFNASLKSSGTNLNTLVASLSRVGPTGQKSIVALAESLANAERKVQHLNSRMQGLLTTLKNTAKWQISSTLLHGFMGALQTAYGYAQDLNSSLNKIRIVTGANIEKMNAFAETANKAAKALSASTLAYTDAALIYYQQGLDDQAVEARTNVTVKMMNVTGKSAEEISSQMTAIWNNFDDGTKSLEYYADAITALGASTASSSKEIAEGLQKFAAVADTVGLSYEYATAALATVVAETRQSADIVGTAFKTLFSRLEGLKLGETLEDGVDLNKYSKALQTVGVNILDANNNLKAMDTILDELGARWDTLTTAQQVALAQTVGGVRQYQQFVALMDNWDKVQKNVLVAANSEGTLQEQADIYAQSWEGAKKRVQASLQDLYHTLLDDSFFIKITDGISHIINGVTGFIKTLGGIKPLILNIASIALANIAHKIQPALMELWDHLRLNFMSAEKQAQQYGTQFKNVLKVANMNNKNNEPISKEDAIRVENAGNLMEMKNKLMVAEESLTKAELEHAQIALDEIQRDQEKLVLQAQMLDSLQKEKQALEKEHATLLQNIESGDVDKEITKARAAEYNRLVEARQKAQEHMDEMRGKQGFGDAIQEYKEAVDAVTTYSEGTDLLRQNAESLTAALLQEYDAMLTLEDAGETMSETTMSLSDGMPTLISHIQELSNESNFDKLKDNVQDVTNMIEQLGISELPEVREALADLLKSTAGNGQQVKKSFDKLLSTFKQTKLNAEGLTRVLRDQFKAGKQMDKLKNVHQKMAKNTKDLVEQEKKVNSLQKQLNQNIKQFNPQHIANATEIFTKLGTSLMNVGMLANSVKSIFSTWANEDMSFGEKLIATFTGLGMILPTVLSLTKSWNAASIESIANMIQQKTATMLLSQEKNAGAVASMANLLIERESLAVGSEELAQNTAQIAKEKEGLTTSIAKALGISQETAAQIVDNAVTTKAIALQNTENITKKKGVISTLKEAAANWVNTASKGSGIVATWAQVAANIAAETSMSPLLVITLMLAAAMLALAAAILIVVGVVKLISNAINAENIERERANELLKENKEALDNAREANEKFLEVYNKYEDAVKKLEKLTKGTQEYRDAVKEANESALEMIDKYDSLAGHYHRNLKTGLIEFDDGALEQVKQEQENRVTAAETAYLSARNTKMEVDNKWNLKHATAQDNKAGKMAKTGGIMVGTSAALAAIPGLGPLLSVISGLAGTALLKGSAVTASAEGVQDKAQSAVLEKFAKIYEANNGITVEQAQKMGLLTNMEASLINSLGMTDSELSKLANEINANTAAIEENNRQIIDNTFKDNDIYANSDNKEALNKVLRNTYKQTSQELYEKIYKDGKGLNDKNAQQAYAEAMGYTWVKNEGKNKGKYKDAEGNELEVDDEVARKYLAQQAALEQLSGTIKQTDAALTKLSQNESIGAQALYSKIMGGSYGDNVEIGKETAQYSVSDIQGNMSDEEFELIWRAAGSHSAQEFVNQLNKELETNLPTIDEMLAGVTNTLSEEARANIEELMTGMTVTQATTFRNAVNDMSDLYGEEFTNDFIGGLEEATNGMSADAKKLFKQELGKIDKFTNAKGWDTFLKNMKDSGKLTTEQAKRLELYVANAKEAANATKVIDFTELTNQLESLSKIMDKAAKGTRDFSDAEYEAMIEAGADSSQFIKTYEGYKYLGDTAVLLEDISANARNSLKDAEDNGRQMIEMGKQMSTNLLEAANAYYNVNEATVANIEANEEEMTQRELLAARIRKIWSDITNWFKEKIEKIKNFLQKAAKWIGENIVDPVIGFFKDLYTTFANFVNGILEGWATFINGIIDIINKIPGVDIDHVEAGHMDTAEEIDARTKREEELRKREDELKQYHSGLMDYYTNEKDFVAQNGYHSSVKEIEKQQQMYQGILAAYDEQIAALEAKGDTLNPSEQKLLEMLKEERGAVADVSAEWEKSFLVKGYMAKTLDDVLELRNHTEAYAAALETVAAQYETCAEEFNKFQTAYLSGNAELIAKLGEELELSIDIAEQAEKYGLDANEIEKQARSIQALNPELKENAKQAAHLVILNQRMNKGIDALSSNMEDWKTILASTTRGSADYAKVAAQVEEAIRDLIGAADSFVLPEGFLDSAENLKLLEQAADGSALAINKLGIAMAQADMQDDIWNQTLIDSYNSLEENTNKITMSMKTSYDIVNQSFAAISEHINELTTGTLTLTDVLGDIGFDETSFVEALNTMAIATGKTKEEFEGLLAAAGIQADVTVGKVEVDTEIPRYVEHTRIEHLNGDDEYDKYVEVEQLEPAHVKKIVEVPQISTTGDVSIPKVQYVGVGGGNKGGGVSKSATTSGKAKNNNKKEKKDKKSAEKETERYHEITALIEDYTRELDKAGKAKDRAFGPAKLKAMQAEIAAQAQLNAATEEHIREIREWLEIDKARIAAQGATFDEYGNISNYTALMQQHIDAYNAAVAAYNASGQSDSDKNRFEAAEKAYEDFMDQLSQYEETNNLLQEKLDELIEAQQVKYDKEFEMLQYTIEFKIEADDSILSYLDYMKNKIENFNNGVYDAVEMLATLNDEASALMNKNSTYNHAIDDTLNHYLSNKGMGESDIEAFIERFKSNNMSESDMSMLEDMTEAEYQYLLELKNNLLEINNSLIENMNAVVETVQNSFSKTAEDLDKATRPIEHAASALENYAAIIDIVGRDALGITDAIAAELDNAAVAVAHSATVAAKTKVDTLQSERDEVQRLYDEAMAQKLPEMAYKWKTVLEEMDEEIAAATDDFNSKWQEELTKAREAFENTVERIKQSMLDAFAGSVGSWSGLKDSLEYAQTAADRFVPQYKEIYELSKLNRDIMKSIDNTSNIKNKQALRDLQKEINELEQHSGEISQYDLDNARRRYELELARLALEEARDAKSTVRLSKDAEGNWSYVYTANQDDVEKAEQNYEDKLYAMQQANNEYINSLSDQILELEEQYAEKLAEIRLDNTMSEEERNAAIERLNAYFSEQMEYLTNEGQKAVDNNSRLFEEEWTTYHNWTDAFGNDTQARIDNQHDFMTQFGDTILGQYTGFGNFNELNSKMVEIAQEASADMEVAYGELADQIATAMEGAGYNVETFGQTVSDTVHNEIVPSAQEAEQAVIDMAKTAADEFATLASSVSKWQIDYAADMKKIIKKNEKLAKSVNKVANAYAALVTQMYAAANAPAPKIPKFKNSTNDQYNNFNNTEDTDTTNPPGGNNQQTPQNQNAPRMYMGRYYNTGNDTYHIVIDVYYDSNKNKYEEERKQELHDWQHSHTTMNSGDYCTICGAVRNWSDIGGHNNWNNLGIDVKKDQIDWSFNKTNGSSGGGRGGSHGNNLMMMDTGGYTGNWNSSRGKLAILHEKELVLNKDDTKNILGTVEMVRKLSSKIDLNAQTARYAFNYHPIISEPRPIDKELQVDQTVTISAEFPNVQNRTEIEEAFTTLINQASQFANRKF